jgi:CubicO group peptidase (beta-lactamase class C family)
LEFERNFAERDEIGAAVAAYWRGEKVVDLWGGRRTPSGDEPWNEDTMVLVNSTTKGLVAMTVAVTNSRGWIDYDAPVAEYWPEFAQDGKAEIGDRSSCSAPARASSARPAPAAWSTSPIRTHGSASPP